jgi:hypothetical protein
MLLGEVPYYETLKFEKCDFPTAHYVIGQQQLT